MTHEPLGANNMIRSFTCILFTNICKEWVVPPKWV